MHEHFNDMDLEQLNAHFFSRDRYAVADLARSYIEMMLEKKNDLYVVESFLDNVDWVEVEGALYTNREEMIEYA